MPSGFREALVLPVQASRAPHLVLRHGESTANVDGIIASSLSTAENAYGLTPRGREQVRTSVTAARAAGTLGDSCRIVTSPLLRARESAEVAAEVLGVGFEIDVRLIERGFGELELASDEHYAQVWAEDRRDPGHERWGVESLTSILRRVRGLIGDLDHAGGGGADAPEHGHVLLCTHGDVASTLFCAAAGEPLGRHRDVGALVNAQIRALTPIEGVQAG